MSSPQTSSSRPRPAHCLLAALLVTLLANAGSATVLRTTSRLAGAGVDAAPLPDAVQGADLDDLDASTLQALSDLTALGSSLGGHQDADGTLDILVDVWGLRDSSLPDGDKPSQRISLPFLPSLLPHINSSCSCQAWQCGCCATVAVAPLRGNNTGCATLSYVKDRLAVVLQMALNNRTLVERELISGSNPPPFCFPIPQFPFVTVCLRFTNITITNDKKVQACASLEVGLAFTSPLLRLRFGCLRIGQGGVSWGSKPVPHSTNSSSDIESAALQQFAAAINTTDKDQLSFLQSILRQKSGVFDQPQPTQLSRSLKMIRPNYQQGARYN